MNADRLIYGLKDPRTGEIRYVGLSTRGVKRPRTHLRSPRSDDHTYRANWLRNINAAQLQPIIIVLQELSTDDELSRAEDYWIRLLRISGCRLTNHKEGGFRGRLSAEHKTRIGNALRGQKRSAEARENGRKAKLGKLNPMFGKPVSKETRAKRSAALSGEKNHRFGMLIPGGEATRFKPGHQTWKPGTKRPDITGDKHPMFGRKHNEHSRQLISQSSKGRVPWNKGRQSTDEERANMSAVRVRVVLHCTACSEPGHNRRYCPTVPYQKVQ